MRTCKNQAADYDILQDTSPTGKVRPWSKYKMANELLSLAYDSIDPHKAERLRGCATWLGFGAAEDGRRKLVQANFCRVRLCPMCQWRRALLNYKYTMRIVSAMLQEAQAEGRQLRWMMVTLTIRSCTGDKLIPTLDQMQVAWDRLTRYGAVMAHVKGWYRGLEITHDCNPLITPEMYKARREYYDKHSLQAGDYNPQYDTYHPHYHLLIAVSDKYTRISYERHRQNWALAWAAAAKLDYWPQVDVQRCRGRHGEDTSPEAVSKMVAEAAKYTAKPKDYILPDDWDLTVDTVRLLDKALHNRRLVAYGKACKEWHKRLHLGDVESAEADLIGLDEGGGKVAPDVIYVWSTGYKQYIADR